jgi:UDP-N-acetylglucosamine acyltransferase
MIHPTALVERSAELGDVEIGPYVVIGPNVKLHDGVRIGPHCLVHSDTEIGPRTVLTGHCALGGDPQDQKHDPRVRTRLQVGADNVFREFVTAHRGTSGGRLATTIGDRGYFMSNSHIAHDCIVGDGVTFANSAAIAGFVQVADEATLGGLAAVHQHCRVGRLAMVGGGAMCSQDVPPFTLAQGDRARLFGVNVIGLRRAGLDDARVSALKEAWRLLFGSELPWKSAISRVEEEHGGVPEVAELVAFLRAATRGVCRAGVQT